MTTYSAPGKALLAGGYLVLFPEFEALSVALSNRIHAVTTQSTETSNTLIIESPQFQKAIWEFPGESGESNPFLNACFNAVSAYFSQQITGKITIWSDDGFHSQSESVEGPNKNFRYHNAEITKVPKTGLGSSAALVAAVIAAMADIACKSKNMDPLSTEQLHNLAQIAHCHAQGKIGSGFDVATAIYGSIVYSRFDKSEIPSDLNEKDVKIAVNKKWNMVSKPCKLPANVQVVMGDVSQGSQTPGMVRGVLEWHQKSGSEGIKLFNDINAANKSLSSALELQVLSPDAISKAILDIRSKIRKLTELSSVPIEPKSQTQLLDNATKVNGVLGGVVPGAGGNDAVCLLVDVSSVNLDVTLSELSKINGVKWIPMGLETKGLVKSTN